MNPLFLSLQLMQLCCIIDELRFSKKMIKKIIFFLFLAVIMVGFYFIVNLKSQINQPIKDPNKLQVVTTLFPIYDFVQNVGQDKVQVTLLLPPGVESHAFEPTPNDILATKQADLFVFTGDFMETWAKDLLDSTANNNGANNRVVVNTSQGVSLISVTSQGGQDPHIWLDFENAQQMVDSIAQGLVQKDPVNDNFYLANATAFKQQLADLDVKFQTELAACSTNKIVYGGHYAFGYLANRYDLEYLPAIKGFEPDSEPTANDLAALIKQVEENNIKYIFYEELSSPKVAQTLASETGTRLLLLHAAHNVNNEDLDAGVNFLSIMEDNLISLKLGLGCL